MATRIGKLSIVLTAPTSQLSKGLMTARQHIGGFTSGILRSTTRLLAFGGAISGVVAGAGLGTLVKQSFSSIDANAKLADALGTSTEEITGLQHAASIAGVSVEELNKDFTKMQRGIGQARQGLSAQVRAFESLGLSADELAATDPSEAFITILDAIDKLPTAADKAATASDIFGRAGMNLLPLANEGADGMRALMAEADKLGITFDRSAAAKVEMANDAMTRAGAIFKGVANTIAIELAPFVTELATRFKDLAVEGEGVGPRFSSGFNSLIESLAGASDFLAGFNAAWQTFKGVGQGAIATIADGLAGLGGLIVEVINLIPGIEAESSGALQMFADEMFASAETAFAEAGKSFDQAISGGASKQAQEFIAGARKRQQEAADKIAADRAAGGAAGLGSESTGKPSSFRQIALGRTAFGGISKKTRTPVQADPAELAILRSINERLGRGVPAMAV